MGYYHVLSSPLFIIMIPISMVLPFFVLPGFHWTPNGAASPRLQWPLPDPWRVWRRRTWLAGIFVKESVWKGYFTTKFMGELMISIWLYIYIYMYIYICNYIYVYIYILYICNYIYIYIYYSMCSRIFCVAWWFSEHLQEFDLIDN